MSDEETGRKARPFTDGNELYQQRARAALPLLVRQAKAQQTIYYAELAHELGMPNPRNLNFVLGSVGRTLQRLGRERGVEIPPIQCLVINQSDEMPGEGVGVFVSKEDFRRMTKREQRMVVQAQLLKVFAYSGWDDVLAAFNMPPAALDFSRLVHAARARGGGESDAHRALKAFVAAHPEVIGLRPGSEPGQTEYALPSGDKLDVLFRRGDDWNAVEVKSVISDDGDLTRGLFQCVKYQAVLEAYLLATAQSGNVRTTLVTPREPSGELRALKNTLGVEWLTIAAPPTQTVRAPES